jgi:hypothetical protein
MKLKAHTITADSASMHSYFIALALALASHSKYSNAYIDFGLNEANYYAFMNMANRKVWIASLDANIVVVKPVWRLYDNASNSMSVKIPAQYDAGALGLNFYLSANLIFHTAILAPLNQSVKPFFCGFFATPRVRF